MMTMILVSGNIAVFFLIKENISSMIVAITGFYRIYIIQYIIYLYAYYVYGNHVGHFYLEHGLFPLPLI